MANKKVYQGVCSSYLRALRPGDRVRLYVRKSTFHMPPSVSNNLIMVGAGTGVAPLRAFIHERRYQLEQLLSTAAPIDEGDNKSSEQDTDDNSEALLFFGCRQRDVDFLYREELLKAEKDGVLSELALAFSREKATKVYVQHLIDKDGTFPSSCNAHCYTSKLIIHVYFMKVTTSGTFFAIRTLISTYAAISEWAMTSIQLSSTSQNEREVSTNMKLRHSYAK